jgi:flotillin
MLEGLSGLFTVVVIAILIIAAVLLILSAYGRLYHRVGPNRALIIYGGAREPQVVKGGGRFVVPLVQRAEELSLELMSFDVAPQQDLYTNQGVSVRVEAVTQLKVRSDRESILTAAEQFLSKTPQDRENLIRLVMEGHLRGIVGQLTVEQIVKEPEMVGEKMRSTSSADLAKMGLEVVSFTIRQVTDDHQYIENMGRPEVERVKKDANVAVALAARDTQIQQANAQREAAVARAAADQERVSAETISEAKQSEFQRDLALKRATYDKEVKTQQVIADKATDLQQQIVQQQIVAETARAQEIEKTAQIKVQEAEASRRKMELEATIVNAADAERQRVTSLAEAERQRISLEAEGRAAAVRAQAGAESEAVKIRGAAEAESTRVRGLAEAEVIRAKGEAEAEAMRVKAAAFHEYNQAAVLDKVISNLPEVVRAIAEPLSKVDKISIVSTGSGSNGNLGANRLTGDIVNMVAQVPLLLEALTGTRMSDLMARVPGLSATNGATEGASGETVEEAAPTPANGAKPAETPRPTATLNGQEPVSQATPDQPHE